MPCTIATYGNAWDGILAFGLTGSSDYLVVMSTNGTLIALRASSTAYGVVKNIPQDTLVFQGEPLVDGSGSAPTYATHIWNVASNTIQDSPNVIGHHDLEYNPINNTFLTLQNYVRQVGSSLILFDKIVQLDSSGNVLWSWDTYDHIPLSEASTVDQNGNPTGFNETTTLNGQTVEDFTHCNSLDWDYNTGIIYLNSRCTNTFYKINQTTGDIIWACGEFGNFTLLGDNGKAVSSLWYHSHDVTEVAPDVFTIFDNDYNNITNPDDCRSRMIELTINETSMMAYADWSWEAPTQYWNSYAGGTTKLPNGDYLGDFGDPTHQFPQNQLSDGTWSFNNTGAVLIEVNPVGQIVRTFTFPAGWYIYRVSTVTNLSQNAFNFTPSPSLSPSVPPLLSPSLSPTTTQTSTTSPSPTSSPTFAPSPTPTPTSQTSQKPSNSSINFQTTIYVAFLIIGAVIVTIVVLFFLRKRRNK